MRVRHRNKGTARHQTGTELQCDDDGEPQMTQQASASTSREDLAASPSSASSDSSTLSAIYPYSVGDKEIVLNNGTISVPQNDLIGTNSGINVVESTDVRIGHETVFNGDVTLIQHVYAQADRGPIGHASEFKKEVYTRVPEEDSSSGTEVHQPRKSIKKIITITSVIVLTTVVAVSLAVYFFSKKSNDQIDDTTESPPPSGPIDRTEWGGRQPLNTTYMNASSLVIIKHTGGTACSDFQACKTITQNLQNRDMDVLKMPDIAYNFLIGGDARIYVGRGWFVTNGGPTAGAVDIAFIGNYTVQVPSTLMLVTLKGFLLDNSYPPGGGLAINYVIVNDNQTRETDGPGENLYREIQNFNRYSSKNYRDETRVEDGGL